MILKYYRNFQVLEADAKPGDVVYVEEKLSAEEQLEKVLTFAKTWEKEYKTVLTMSDTVVLGIRLAVKRHIIRPEMTTIHYFPAKTLDEYNRYWDELEVLIDNNGSLSQYPNGFMDTCYKVLLELMR